MKTLTQLFLFTITTVVIALLLLWAVTAFGLRSPFFAFLVNWLVMSWVAMSSQVIQF